MSLTSDLTSDLSKTEGTAAPRAVTPPRPALPLAFGATAGILAVAALAAATAWSVRDALPGGAMTAGAGALAVTVAVLPLLRPAVRALRAGRDAATAWAEERRADARRLTAEAREDARTVLGWCLVALCLLGGVWFVLANDRAVQRTFFDGDVIGLSITEIAAAFGTNLFIAVVAQLLILVWGLALALARMAPGRAGRPLRLLATGYIDGFRAVPAIIIIYLIGFGLPLAEVPLLSSLSPVWFAILALTLTYGAYVAEVFRAGIESIAPGQTAAARSLGLSQGATLRHVVLPQATRRVVPPLLNDFISLQKDTALVNVIGTIDAFNQSKIYASNHFNLSSVTVVALLFVVITIPQARLVDRLVARENKRGKEA
ncbi:MULTISPECIES: amino acid ABC transporter permease [Streptomyces]|uniref:Amino acid ABC transporter permease n=1 Tax=Streptomyces solicathayae TaxID=3081768 RepID=A0ABZ0LQ27_9ACTN|nr:amino acid ABC transporter permease [Streptomyces sp. HUAS YS2]WOX21457.1 amino acid ABC transporter permease [Streptomyces sp. HUAS YS2]